MMQIGQALKGNRWVRRMLWLVAGWLLLWLVAWLAVPPIARTQIERHASEALGRKVTVARVEFSPWSLEATLHGLGIASQDGSSSQVQVGRIYMDAELQSLWRLAPVVDAVQVDDPVIHVSRSASGSWDFEDVLARLNEQSKPKDEPSTVPRFAIYNIAVNGGAADFDDRAVDRTHTLRDLRLQIPFLSSFSADREVRVTPRLAFELNGSAFDSAAEATPFADNRHTDLNLRFQDFDLAPLGAYLPGSVPVRLGAGRLGADLRIGFEQAGEALLRIRGAVQLKGAQITDAGGRALLDFSDLQVRLKDVQPLQRMVDIESIDLTGAQAYLRRAANGAVELPAMGDQTEQSDAAQVAPAADASQGAWQLRLARLGLRDASVDWQDASLPGGKAEWRADKVQLQATEIALPQQQPLQFRASAQLTGGSARGEAARLAMEGQATDSQAKAAVSLRGLPLEMAAPYLAQLIQPGLTGMVDADLGLARQGKAMAAQVARLSVDRLALQCPAAANCAGLRRAGVADAGKTSLLEWGQLEVTDTLALLPAQRVTVGRVLLNGPKALVSRSRKGEWMFEQWLAQVPAAPAAKASRRQDGAAAKAEGAAWAVQLAALEVNGASVAVRDELPQRPVALRASGLQLRVRDLSYADGRLTPATVQLDTRVAAGRTEPGRLRWDGSLAMNPALNVQGRLHAQHLPLHAFEPYVTADLNVDILRADGSFDGRLRYTQEKAGPRVSVSGDASLDEVRVRAKDEDGDDGADERSTRIAERGEELLRWKTLALRGVAVDLRPGRPLSLDVQETALSDFFARVIVHENGRINLQDLRKGEASDAPAATPPAQAEGNAPGAASTQVPAAAPPADPMAPVIRFGPVALTNGAVRFSDFFIKPNYSADLSELTGRLSAFSSVPAAEGAEPAMADLELHGRAQGTAALEILGKVNPLAKPLALDVQGHMTDLELPPLSPYSVKYAGHGIERGKLSMDVAYKVQPDGQLTASNRLVLKQLAFGDPVEGAPASLPVRLAVALLADRNGVIDVELPISGSLNDPQFSLGGVILKVIGNLVMKAITAPFSLLAGAFGGGDEQGVVSFAPGSSVLDDKARELLDKIAKQLADRPALQVTVVGWAQPQAERAAWKRQRLADLVLAQKRRAAASAGAAPADVVSVSEAEYPALLKEAYRRADIKKPRNLIGMAKDLPQAEMEALLLDSIAVPESAMSDLALARGVAVRDYLASRQVPADRLFVGAPKLQPEGEGATRWTPKAELALATR